jgi:hypothetical protein
MNNIKVQLYEYTNYKYIPYHFTVNPPNKNIITRTLTLEEGELIKTFTNKNIVLLNIHHKDIDIRELCQLLLKSDSYSIEHIITKYNHII